MGRKAHSVFMPVKVYISEVNGVDSAEYEEMDIVQVLSLAGFSAFNDEFILCDEDLNVLVDGELFWLEGAY